MKMLALTFAVVTLIAGSAVADCGTDLKSFWDKLEHKKYTGLSPVQLAARSRMAC